MSQSYKNKYAVILGGSAGLGLATAKKLAHEGMNIIIIHRSRRSVVAAFEDAVREMEVSGCEIISYNTDALNPKKRQETVDDILAKLGKGVIKLILHSIARGNLKPLYDTEGGNTLSNEDFKGTLDAMAVSYYDWVSAFAKAELFTPFARAIAFTSEGSSRAWPQYAAVAAAKAALESISRGIALEFAPLGITSNCIQAGVTDTESLRLIPGSDKMKEMAVKRNPYQRLTLPNDVANAVYLLTRDEASWINGTTIPVDGGEHIR